MEWKDANELVSKFDWLVNFESKHFESTVDLVFVSFMDEFLAMSDYGCILRSNSRMPIIPLDEGRFTIIVAFRNKKVTDIKTFVLTENIMEIKDAVQKVDRMIGKGW